MDATLVTLGDLFTNETARTALVDVTGDLDMFFGTAIAQSVPLSKLRLTAWNILKDDGSRRAMLQRAGAPVDQIDAIMAEINMAWPILFPAAVVAEVKVVVDTTTRASAADQRRDMAARMRSTAKMVGSFIFTDVEVQRLADLAFMYSTYGYEVAQLDHYVARAAKDGAGKYIKNDWMLRVLNKYETNKDRASDILIPADDDRGIREFHLELVPEAARVSFWGEVNTALTNSGFYTLIEQLAFWARATGKASALSRFSNVQSTMSEARYDPGQMKRLHEKVLKALAMFMEDRTRVLMADRIAMEHVTVVQNALHDEDMLYFLCRPPRDVQDVVAYFWNTDQVDLDMERSALKLAEAITAAIEALAQYDASRDYAEQMDTFSGAANEVFTLLEEMGALVPRRYNIQQDAQPGIKGLVTTLMAAVSVRVRVGKDGSIEVEARAGASVTTGPVRAANGLFPLDEASAEFIRRKQRELHANQLKSYDTTAQLNIIDVSNEIARRYVNARVGVNVNRQDVQSVGWGHGAQYQRQDEQALLAAYRNRENDWQAFANAWFLVLARSQASPNVADQFDK